MTRKLRKAFCVVLSLVMIVLMCFSTVVVSSAASQISYTFTKSEAGYAQGTISLTADKGTYELYWADDTKALDGYSEICTLTLSSSATKSYTMPQYTAIPDGATNVIAVKKSEENVKIYFINNVGWSKVYCHAYENANTANRNAAWPGIEMDYVATNSDGYKVYSIELDPSFDEMQFDNGSSGNKNQTVDITIGSKNAYIVNNTSTSGQYTTDNITYGTETGSTVSYLVSDAYARFSIPQSKRVSGEKLYSFASYSDIQLDNTLSGYPHGLENFRLALDFAQANDAQLIITSGDNVNNQSISTQKTEWDHFNRILAESDYCNPIYESIGNHEVWPGVKAGTDLFIKQTGLDCTDASLNSGKAYYEVTKNGDHFIFMSLEGGFYPDQVDEFSDAQLSWLEGLLKKYSGDGHNIFVIEHSLFDRYGAGDDPNNPYYDIPLTDDFASTRKLKSLLEQYKDVIFITGHSHIEFAKQYNYSDNNGQSCQMIHNSSVGGSRSIAGSGLDLSYSPSDTEGYIVDVYADRLVFKGANMYYGEFMPSCTYFVKTSASMLGIEPSIELPTEEEVVINALYGDADDDKSVSIADATIIQKVVVRMVDESRINKTNADVDGDGSIGILDATLVQKRLMQMISSYPVESKPVDQPADFTNIMPVAEDLLETAYVCASYDQYMELKKMYKGLSNGTIAKTQKQYQKFDALCDEVLAISQTFDNTPSGKQITVYFENTHKWSSVYAYAWGVGGKYSSWPGTAMTKAGTSKNGYDLYKFSLDFDSFQSIIFNNGTDQTVDISLSGDDNVVYKLSSQSDGKYTVTTADLSSVK